MADLCKQDLNDLKELFAAQLSQINVLITANDKNYNQRFDNVLQATKAALDAADRAVSKAESATEKRFESVNEFRQTLSDQASKFIIRSEFDLVVDRLEQDIKNLVITRADMLTTKQYDSAHKDLVKQVDDLKLTVATTANVKDLQKQVDDLRLSRALLEGKASQESVIQVSSRAQLGILFGAIGTIIAILGFVSKYL